MPPATEAIGVNKPLAIEIVPPDAPETVKDALEILKALKSLSKLASATVSLAGKSLTVILLAC